MLKIISLFFIIPILCIAWYWFLSWLELYIVEKHGGYPSVASLSMYRMLMYPHAKWHHKLGFNIYLYYCRHRDDRVKVLTDL